ncbi:MAG: Gfo/Idh/MocA family oxidoreductase [Chloroflexota bacterium]
MEAKTENLSLQKYETQMKYFIDCIQLGKTPNPGGKEGWINMQVLDAAYESSLTGKVVNI